LKIIEVTSKFIAIFLQQVRIFQSTLTDWRTFKFDLY